MLVIFNVSDTGQDSTDGSFICAVSDEELAKRVASKQGSMGQGLGDIKKVEVYENFNELPEEIKNRILKDESLDLVKKEKLIKKLKENFSPEEIELLKNI